jgi:transaldolase
MSNSLNSLIRTGTKLWLDSVDPDLVTIARNRGSSGATSNPIIIADLLKSGRFDRQLEQLMEQGLTDEQVAWKMTDQLVREAQSVFQSVWERTSGNNGYVSFELDPLIEDPKLDLPLARRVSRYVELGKRWSAGHQNRMIKVPATPAGLASLEDLAAAGIPLNVTLIFSLRQYEVARDAIWRGVQKLTRKSLFKSVYSIFVSRVDVFTEKQYPQLSAEAQGMVGILNAKRIWQSNFEFWRDKGLELEQEIVFASTGTKKPTDLPWKYVAALAGSDIQTNPPATNDAVAANNISFTRQVDNLPAAGIIQEIDQLVDLRLMEETLMREGVAKFADPQHELLAVIGQKRLALSNLSN